MSQFGRSKGLLRSSSSSCSDTRPTVSVKGFPDAVVLGHFIHFRWRLCLGVHKVQLESVDVVDESRKNGLTFRITTATQKKIEVSLVCKGTQQQRGKGARIPLQLVTHEESCSACKQGEECDRSVFSSASLIRDTSEIVTFVQVQRDESGHEEPPACVTPRSFDEKRDQRFKRLDSIVTSTSTSGSNIFRRARPSGSAEISTPVTGRQSADAGERAYVDFVFEVAGVEGADALHRSCALLEMASPDAMPVKQAWCALVRLVGLMCLPRAVESADDRDEQDSAEEALGRSRTDFASFNPSSLPAGLQDLDALALSLVRAILKHRRHVILQTDECGATLLHYLLHMDLSKAARCLIDEIPEMVCMEDCNRMSAFHVAAIMGNTDVLQAILEQNLARRTPDIHGTTPPEYATFLGNSEACVIFSNTTSKDEQAAPTGRCALPFSTGKQRLSTARARASLKLLSGAFLGDRRCLTQLVEHLPPALWAMLADTRKCTLLHAAACLADSSTLELLVRRGCNVAARDDDGNTPLHIAAQSGSVACCRMLVEGKASMDCKNAAGRTPLLVAVAMGNAGCYECLLAHGASTNEPDSSGNTALHHAAVKGFASAVTMLLSHGADIAHANAEGSTPLHFAALASSVECVRALLKAGATSELNGAGLRPLHCATQKGCTDVIRVLVDHFDDVDCTTADDSKNPQATSLHLAAGNGFMDVVVALLDLGADINAVDDNGACALHYAAQAGSKECMTLLLQRGVDTEVQDNSENTPLHIVSMKGRLEALKLLLSLQANINSANTIGLSPLHLAVQSGHVDCAMFLMKGGALLNVEDDYGRYPLHLAVAHVECVEFLLEKGADPNATDRDGETPLFKAVRDRSDESARILIAKGSNMGVKNSKGQSLNDVADEYMRKVLHGLAEERGKSQDKKRQQQVDKAVRTFNNSPTEGLKLLKMQKLFESGPAGVAKFFHTCHGVSKKKIGEILGQNDDFSIAVLDAFVDYMELHSLKFDEALRLFLSKFKLAGEAQKIDRIMERFARKYCASNPGVFKTEDSAYLLAFSLIMLNTDAHNPSIKHKMTKEQFIKNNTGFDGADIPVEQLERYYEAIVSCEIRMDGGEDSGVDVKMQGWLLKRGARLKMWNKRWFVLVGNTLYYMKQPPGESMDQTLLDDCGSKIQLQDVFIRQVTGKKKFGFEIYHPHAAGAKALQDSVILTAQTKEEAEAWFSVLQKSVASTPYKDLMDKRKRVQTFMKGTSNKVEVDFSNLSSYANLCRICEGSTQTIRDAFGSAAHTDEPYKNVSFFAVINHSQQQQTVILGSSLINTPDKMQKELDNSSSFLVHDKSKSNPTEDAYSFTDIAKHIFKLLNKVLKKDFQSLIVAHSFGGCVGLRLGKLMLADGFKMDQVVTFGLPRTILKSHAQQYENLKLLQVQVYSDPISTLYPGYADTGSRLILLRRSHYCFVRKEDLDLTRDMWRDQTVNTHHIDYYIKLLLGMKASASPVATKDVMKFAY